MILIAGGFALLVPTWISIVGLVLLVGSVELQVRLVEEPYLRRLHGSAYAGYVAAVGRFLPKVGRPRSGGLAHPH
jgi:protein-S-isoprenylcysteine O-methyltransferase Ste14